MFFICYNKPVLDDPSSAVSSSPLWQGNTWTWNTGTGTSDFSLLAFGLVIQDVCQRLLLLAPLALVRNHLDKRGRQTAHVAPLHFPLAGGTLVLHFSSATATDNMT